MKLESRVVKVYVKNEEAARLDRWADVFNVKTVDTVLHMSGSGKSTTEKNYKFPSIKEKEKFLTGVTKNFGNDIWF